MAIRIVLWSVVALTALAGFGWLFHRICTCLEDAGYLYYRKTKGGGGGVAGAFNELDRLTRPSIQHVVEIEDTAKTSKEDVGGE